MPSYAAKGKAKARAVAEQEGPGGPDGIVLPLQVTGTGVYDIAYTIEAKVGADEQTVSLQVDTGSSDLWITSRWCTSSLCGQTNGHVYDPSGSTSTQERFNITYLSGHVEGPIVWDKFTVGGYSIENQALAAADDIQSEPLSPLFNGILGLSLPLNSIIAESIPPVTSNSPDGAAWASNLFSITPVSAAPSSRFLSLSLSRPGSSTVPSLLGIGRHPSFITNSYNISDVNYAPLVPERSGTLFWKVSVRAITVWVDGQERPVEIGRSNSGAVFPSAVLDSGVPLILTTRQVANAIYGAIGVSPASDGQYYVPCTTPLNMTITVDDRPPLPLHPLDLTAEPPKDNQAEFCIGLIQPADTVLAQPNSLIGDMILGVPFMRNMYSIMAYTVPDHDGSFPSPSVDSIRPRLGLLGLTDPTIALDEFRKVRVLNQPISPDASSTQPNNSPGANTTAGGKRLSVGIIVLIGLLGFFALCLTLFGIRWWFFRRRYRRSPSGTGMSNGSVGRLGAALGEKEGGYALAARGSRDLGATLKSSKYGAEGEPNEDVLRTLRYEAYMQDHALVDLTAGLAKKESTDSEAEMGYRRRRREDDDPWDPNTAHEERDAGWGDETLVMGRNNSERDLTGLTTPKAHERSTSVGVPLLLHEIDPPDRDRDQNEGTVDLAHDDDMTTQAQEFGVLPLDGDADEDEVNPRASMAGVGTAARGGKVGGWKLEDSALGGGVHRRLGQESSGTTSGSDGEITFLRPLSR